MDVSIKGKKSSGPQDGTVLHGPVILAGGRISKSASDHISVQVVQRIIWVYLLTFSGLIDREGLSSLFYQLAITCKDGSTAHGGVP